MRPGTLPRRAQGGRHSQAVTPEGAWHHRIGRGVTRGALNLSYRRTNKLVDSLVELGVLSHWGAGEYNRRFAAPSVIDVLLGSDPTKQSS